MTLSLHHLDQLSRRKAGHEWDQGQNGTWADELGAMRTTERTNWNLVHSPWGPAPTF